MNKQSKGINISKAALFGWCLFDFGYSVAAMIGGIYFAKWFIEDLNANSILLNLLFLSSGIIIMFVGKWIGRKIDQQGYKFWIKTAAIISFLAILLLFLSSQFIQKQFLIPLSFLFNLLFLFGYQMGRICHNVYLYKIIPDELQSKMSGYGTGANWAGSIVGICMTIPIITHYPKTLGRELTFLLAAISFGIFAFISIVLMFLAQQENLSKFNVKQIKISWKSVLLYSLSPILVYFLLFDAMVTVQRNLPPFLTEIFNMTDNDQALGFLVTLTSAAVGGFLAAKVINFKNSKNYLMICSLSLSLSIILITLHSSYALWIAFITAGISYGMLESAMRINYMTTFSSNNAGENFGILAVVERTAGILGPIVWSIPFLFLGTSTSYILAMNLMAGLTFTAFIILISKKRVNT